MAAKALSTAKKKRARIAVRMKTMTAVTQVSLDVGQTTLPASTRTWRMNSPGVVLAIGLASSSDRKTRSADGSAGPRSPGHLAWEAVGFKSAWKEPSEE